MAVVYCKACNLRIASYEDKSYDGTMHAQCARKNRASQIPLGVRPKRTRPGSMTEAELNDWRNELRDTYKITYR